MSNLKVVKLRRHRNQIDLWVLCAKATMSKRISTQFQANTSRKCVSVWSKLNGPIKFSPYSILWSVKWLAGHTWSADILTIAWIRWHIYWVSCSHFPIIINSAKRVCPHLIGYQIFAIERENLMKTLQLYLTCDTKKYSNQMEKKRRNYIYEFAMFGKKVIFIWKKH